MNQANHRIGSPADLVAVAKAAHVTGDRDLERAARRLLLEQHGIELIFRRPDGAGRGRSRSTAASKLCRA
jgi:hypothetical protein